MGPRAAGAPDLNFLARHATPLNGNDRAACLCKAQARRCGLKGIDAAACKAGCHKVRLIAYLRPNIQGAGRVVLRAKREKLDQHSQRTRMIWTRLPGIQSSASSHFCSEPSHTLMSRCWSHGRRLRLMASVRRCGEAAHVFGTPCGAARQSRRGKLRTNSSAVASRLLALLHDEREPGEICFLRRSAQE